jgi:hypothetical protein
MECIYVHFNSLFHCDKIENRVGENVNVFFIHIVSIHQKETQKSAAYSIILSLLYHITIVAAVLIVICVDIAPISEYYKTSILPFV